MVGTHVRDLFGIKIQPDAVHDCNAPPPCNTCHQEVFISRG